MKFWYLDPFFLTRAIKDPGPHQSDANPHHCFSGCLQDITVILSNSASARQYSMAPRSGFGGFDNSLRVISGRPSEEPRISTRFK